MALTRVTDKQVTYKQGDTGSTVRNLGEKLRDSVSVKDFGAVGDGVADDTAAIIIALAASYDVFVPIGTYLISSTVNIPTHTKLHMQGGLGNSSGSYPQAHFIKKSTMTTVGMTIASTGWVSGGGLICQAGNTGDGIALVGNSGKLDNFLVHGAGDVGVRVGVTGTTNCNSCELHHVTSQYNGSHGIYVHQGLTSPVDPGQSNTNAGMLSHCFSQNNGGDGILVGRAWWWTLLTCLTEGNAGWGLNLSSIVEANDTVAECRYAQVFGGDFNEGNTAGSINLASYASCVYMATSNQVLVNTGVFCNVYGSSTEVSVGAITVGAGLVNAPAIKVAGDTNTGMWFPAADTIALSTGGTECLRVNSGGEVGIAVAPLAGTTLNVAGNTQVAGITTMGASRTKANTVVVVASVQSADLYTIATGVTIFDIYAYGTGAALQTTALITSDGATHTLTLLKSGTSSVLTIVGNSVRVTCANSLTLNWVALRIN